MSNVHTPLVIGNVWRKSRRIEGIHSLCGDPALDHREIRSDLSGLLGYEAIEAADGCGVYIPGARDGVETHCALAAFPLVTPHPRSSASQSLGRWLLSSSLLRQSQISDHLLECWISFGLLVAVASLCRV